MKNIYILILTLLCIGMGYAISDVKHSISESKINEEIVSSEIQLLERFKTHKPPCEALEKSEENTFIPEQHDDFMLIWRMSEGHVTRLIISPDFKLALEDVDYRCQEEER